MQSRVITYTAESITPKSHVHGVLTGWGVARKHKDTSWGQVLGELPNTSAPVPSMPWEKELQNNERRTSAWKSSYNPRTMRREPVVVREAGLDGLLVCLSFSYFRIDLASVYF